MEAQGDSVEFREIENLQGFRNWRGKGGEIGAMEKIVKDGTG